MDVQFFLQQRLDFIRRYYASAAAPFLETIRKIEDEEEPYAPPYSEDGEPAFMEEWIEAQTAVEVTGHACVSMLSESLKLYFVTQLSELRLTLTVAEVKLCSTSGFFNGYRAALEEYLGVTWEASGASLKVIEQVVLARNDSQHPDSLISFTVQHRASLRKFRSELFFAREIERAATNEDISIMSFMSAGLHVTQENLSEAITEIERLSRWLEKMVGRARYSGPA
jgi:hypothetical protein